MGDTEERGPGPSLDLPPGSAPDVPGSETPDAPEPEVVPAPLAVELGSRVPDWAPIAAVVLLVVLGVVALAMRVF